MAMAQTIRADAVSLAEMDAAAALLELHAMFHVSHKHKPGTTADNNPVSAPEQKPASSRQMPEITSNKNHEALKQNGEQQPERKTETEPTPSTSFRHSIDLKVTVTSGNSKRLLPGPSGLSSQKPLNVVKLPGGGYIIRNPITKPNNQLRHLAPSKKRLNLHKKYLEEQKRWSKENKANMRCELADVRIIARDASTQTELDYQLPNMAKMEAIIKELCAKISDLEQQLERLKKSPERANRKRLGSEDDEDDDEAPAPPRRKYVRRAKSNSGSHDNSTPSPAAESEDDVDDSDYTIKEEEKSGEVDMSDDDEISEDEQEYSSHVRKSKGGPLEMVAIGDGNASVPARLLRQLDWTSYTNATRKLLTAVFSRRVLATHSLTGKPSPAFPDKPAKKKLDSALVNDIVQTVVERCKVPENVVRTSITTKCADESKMFRSRQQNKTKRRLSKKENVPPSPSSEDSYQDS